MGPPIHVWFPNVQTIELSKLCLLDFPYLPDESCEGHILPRLTHSSLVSIGNLFDAVCISVFKSKKVTIKIKQQNSHSSTKIQKKAIIENSRSLPISVRHQHQHRKNRATECIKHHRYQNWYNTDMLKHSALYSPRGYMPLIKGSSSHGQDQHPNYCINIFQIKWL